MKKIGLILTITAALLCSACGGNGSAAGTDEIATGQVAESTAEATEISESEDNSKPADNSEQTDNPELTDSPELANNPEPADNPESAEPTSPITDESASDEPEEEVLPFNKISVARWDDLSHDFYVDATLYYAKNNYVYNPWCDYEIQPEDNLESIGEKNKEHLTGKGKYKDDEGKKHDALFFFYNNNAYVLYDTKESPGDNCNIKSTYIHLKNRMIWDELEYYDPVTGACDEYVVKVPFPVYVAVTDDEVRECYAENISWEKKHLFSLCSFKYAKEFYSMFSDGTAAVDEKDKVIKVKGTISSIKTKENDTVIAILDYKNKTYELQNEDGTAFHSEKTLYDRIAKFYKSAGSIDGKEVLYDTADNIIVNENGKRHTIMSSEKISEFIDEKISAYNCVGKELIFKLTKIKGDKYYIDVTATLEEEGEWTENAALVIKDKHAN